LKITLPAEEWAFLVALVQRIKTESAALGYVTVTEEGLVVHDLFVPEQEVTGATFEMDKTSVGKIAEENRVKKGLDIGDIRFQWHSHGTMSPGPSSVDAGNVVDLLSCSGTWLLTMIMNRSLEYTLQLDVLKPHHARITGLQLDSRDSRVEEAIRRVHEERRVGDWRGAPRMLGTGFGEYYL